MSCRKLSVVMLIGLMPIPALGWIEEDGSVDSTAAEGVGSQSGIRQIVEAIPDSALRDLVAEVLDRNPGLASTEAKAEAASHRGRQAKALPDPMVGLTYFVDSPETRVGPQEWVLGVSQKLPWPNKLSLMEEAADHGASLLRSQADAERLRLITETRTLSYELGFSRQQEIITREFLEHLIQHEEIARTRYATGGGLGQGVIKLQAEITRIENRLLEIDSREAGIAAKLNGLRDRPAGTVLPTAELAAVSEPSVELSSLRERALHRRPDLAASESAVARARIQVALAERQRRPDFTVGLTYAFVGERGDHAGIVQPPPDNGKDVIGIQGGISLPIWRKKLESGEAEAEESLRAATEDRNRFVTLIEAALADLSERIPLIWRRLRLLEDLLIVQAEEALQSAEAGYIAGTLNALDLLDAEHVLFDARIAVVRARTDLWTSLAELDGAIGEPLSYPREQRGSES